MKENVSGCFFSEDSVVICILNGYKIFYTGRDIHPCSSPPLATSLTTSSVKTFAHTYIFQTLKQSGRQTVRISWFQTSACLTVADNVWKSLFIVSCSDVNSLIFDRTCCNRSSISYTHHTANNTSTIITNASPSGLRRYTSWLTTAPSAGCKLNVAICRNRILYIFTPKPDI